MIFTWGSGTDLVWLREAGVHECKACLRDCHFDLVLRYDFVHVYSLFWLITKRQLLRLCNRCDNTWKVTTDEVADAKQLLKTPLPFLRRWGCLVFLLLVVAVFAIIFVHAEMSNRIPR